MLGTYHLNALFDILNKIHFIYEPQKLWEFVLEQACKTLQSEAGTFFELSDNEEELRVKAAHGIALDRLNQIPFKVGTGISGWVAQYHQAALVNDVRQDNRFNRQADIITGFVTKSILCTPVLSMKRTYGVMEIINRRSGVYNPQDQEFMTLLGRQAAVAYQNLLLMAEVSHTKVLMESLLENLSGGLIAMDASGLILVLNPASTQLLHLAGEKVVGKAASEILKAYPWFIEILQKTLRSKETVSRQETSVTIAGQPQRIGYTTILIRDHEKNMLGSGIIFQKLSN